MDIQWKSHEEQPEPALAVGLLARPANPEDPEDVPYIAGLYMWAGGTWKREETDDEPDAPYFWILESDLVDMLAAEPFRLAQPVAPALPMPPVCNRVVEDMLEWMGEGKVLMYAWTTCLNLGLVLHDLEMEMARGTATPQTRALARQRAGRMAIALSLLRPLLGEDGVALEEVEELFRLQDERREAKAAELEGSPA